ncbi:MAG TPA: hypothetical protein VMX35_10950 [Acidobacteriota bacterium]|nr:hypothetical protein [Acidobacteriota bacterium]
MSRAAPAAMTIALILILSSCGLIGDEAAARGALHNFFDAAQRGEIERALEWVSPEQPTAKLLGRLKQADSTAYGKTLADLGERMRKGLQGIRLHVSVSTIDGERGVIAGMILRQGVEEKPFAVTTVKHDGRWLLESLPEISLVAD